MSVTTILIILEDSTVKFCIKIIKTKKCQPDAGDRPDLIQTEPVPSTGLARQTNYLSNIMKISRVQVTKKLKTKKCQPDAGDRPDLIQTEPVPSTGLARQINYLSNISRVQVMKISRVQVTKITKTKKCQPDAGDRPDLIQTATVPSTGLARQNNKNKQNEKMKTEKLNYLSNALSNDQADNLSVASKLFARRTNLSQEINSPDSLPVANKVSEDTVKQPDDKWITVVLTKTKKCQPAARETLSSGHTLHTVVVPVSWHTSPGHTLHTVVVPVSTGHTVHTPRVTVLVPVRPGHTVHTLVPRVTDQVPVGSHTSSGHTLHTVVVPVSHINTNVPDSRLARQQNKNKRNEKYKNIKSNYLQNVVNSVKLFKQSQETQDKPFILSTGHTVHTPRVTVLVPARPGHTVHTLDPRVTVLVPVGESLLCILQQSLFWSLSVQAGTMLISSLKSQVTPFILSTGHTVHTPRVTVQVPVRPGHTVHTLVPRVTVQVPVGESLLCILQQSLFWSLSDQAGTTLVSSLKSHRSYSVLVIPFILRESLFRSLSGPVIPFIL